MSLMKLSTQNFEELCENPLAKASACLCACRTLPLSTEAVTFCWGSFRLLRFQKAKPMPPFSHVFSY